MALKVSQVLAAGGHATLNLSIYDAMTFLATSYETVTAVPESAGK